MRVEQERQLIDEAIQESRAPRRLASGRTVIASSLGRGDKSYLVLANGDKLTRAGEYYYSETNALRPAKHFDRNAHTVRKGDGDYIQTSSGLRRVRQIMPDGTMSLTALGRKFYKDKNRSSRRNSCQDSGGRFKKQTKDTYECASTCRQLGGWKDSGFPGPCPRSKSDQDQKRCLGPDWRAENSPGEDSAARDQRAGLLIRPRRGLAHFHAGNQCGRPGARTHRGADAPEFK